MTLKPGQLVGNRCEIIRLLGEGNFGKTYLAKDLHSMGELCAVKQFDFTGGSKTILKKAQDLFEREAKVLKILTNTPGNSHIPIFFGYFNEDLEFYLVQEFIEGQSLREELKQKSKLSENEVVHILNEVLEGLNFLHGQMFIHRDIKPENLMRRTSNNSMVLIDFGAVKQEVTQLTSPQTQIYTPGYAPPEQYQGLTSKNSDIYALGITAIEALTGLDADKIKDNFTGKIIWPSQLRISEELVEILTKMVQEDYRKCRYQSALEVLKDLKKYSKNTTVMHPVPKQEQGKFKIYAPIMLVSMVGIGIFFFAFGAFRGENINNLPSSMYSPKPKESLTPKAKTSPIINCGPFRQNGEVCPEDPKK